MLSTGLAGKGFLTDDVGSEGDSSERADVWGGRIPGRERQVQKPRGGHLRVSKGGWGGRSSENKRESVGHESRQEAEHVGF